MLTIMLFITGTDDSSTLNSLDFIVFDVQDSFFFYLDCFYYFMFSTFCIYWVFYLAISFYEALKDYLLLCNAQTINMFRKPMIPVSLIVSNQGL